MSITEDTRARPADSRNGFGACNFFLGSPSDAIHTGSITKEQAIDLMCERIDCGKTWREHHAQAPKRPAYEPGMRRY